MYKINFQNISLSGTDDTNGNTRQKSILEVFKENVLCMGADLLNILNTKPKSYV